MPLMVKNPPANTGDSRDVGSIPRPGRSLEEKTAAPSSVLAWQIPRTEEPGGRQSKGRKESDMTGGLSMQLWGSRDDLWKGSLESRNLCVQVGKESEVPPWPGLSQGWPSAPCLSTRGPSSSVWASVSSVGLYPGPLIAAPAEGSQGQRAPGRQGHAVCPLLGVQPLGGWELPGMRAMLTESFWGS